MSSIVPNLINDQIESSIKPALPYVPLFFAKKNIVKRKQKKSSYYRHFKSDYTIHTFAQKFTKY